MAKEIKKYRGNDLEDEMFSAMPPLEAVKMVISHVASYAGICGERSPRRGLMIADVSRAYFNAPARRAIYVEIPAEDQEPGDEDKCGRLLASMYGTRDAARNWYEELKRTLVDRLGAEVGVASPSTFKVRGK